MSNLFSNKGVEEAVIGGGNQKYIYGGVFHDVVISDVRSGASSQKGTPFIELDMHTREGGPATKRAFQFYMSEGAAKTSKSKLRHIATKIVKLAEFEAVEANTLEEYTDAIADLIKGQSLRMKFTAEQYRNANGEVKDAARIGLPEFAEAIQDGAEFAPVADEDTKLTYDKNSQWDFKRLPIEPTDEGALNGATQGINTSDL